MLRIDCPTRTRPPCTLNSGELGSKKRRKSLAALKESDLALLVVDVARHARAAALADSLRWELELLDTASRYGVVPLLVFNLKARPACFLHLRFTSKQRASGSWASNRAQKLRTLVS